MYAYVGSRTTRERNARGEGITVFRVDPASASLNPIQVVRDLVNPSFLTLNRSGTCLYTVHGDLDYVSAFRIDPGTGQLEFINRQSTGGKNPVHLALDPSERFLLVSNHLGGSLAVLPLGEEGSLLPVSQLIELQGDVGPHRIEQTQAKPHFNGFDPSGRFVVVPDKGLDQVFCFGFDAGALTPARMPHVRTREGAGPRHQVFHAGLPILYVINELDSTVTVYRFDADHGELMPMQRISTLPETCTGDSRAAGIALAPNGLTLYASNRGHDSIATFAIDPDSGLLRFLDAIASQGRTPRCIALNPTGTRLYVLNEDSDNIVVLAVDPLSGRLTQALDDIFCASPVCMVFA